MLIHINDKQPQAQAIQQIVDCLKNDGVIIYPTDTVYAIGCDITKQKAVERICRIKDIKPEKANFSFVCSDLSHLSEYAKPISNAVFRVMKKSMPGPYTFILEASNNVPKLLKQNKKTVGIRVPDNAICKAIVEALGNPILSTSLKDTGDDIMEYFADPEIIHQQYETTVDLVINGGFGNLHASTILDCSQDEIIVIREGMGSLDVLN